MFQVNDELRQRFATLLVFVRFCCKFAKMRDKLGFVKLGWFSTLVPVQVHKVNVAG